MLSSTTHHLCSFLSIVAQLQYWLQSLCHELESCFFLLIVATSVVPSRLCCGVFFVAKSLRSESGWRVSWYSPQVFLLVEFNLTQLLLFTLFSQRGLSLLRLLELPSAIYISEQSAFAAAVNIKCITPCLPVDFFWETRHGSSEQQILKSFSIESLVYQWVAKYDTWHYLCHYYFP